MKNKLFIALDVDGVLNSNQDHLKLAELQQAKDIFGMVKALQNEIKFSKIAASDSFCKTRTSFTESKNILSPIFSRELLSLNPKLTTLL